MQLPSVVIVSPALAGANNGNWQTAWRWKQFLRTDHSVRITQQWPDAHAARDDVLLALHARKSAASVQAWAQAHGPRGLCVVLTGTDLYQDIAADEQARSSLVLAQRLVVLQELGVQALPAALRAKAGVIYQSTSPRRALAKGRRTLRAVMVGHLRQVKSPQTWFEAARLLPPETGIRLCHIGDASDPALGEQARATMLRCPHYQWLGGKPHGWTRQAIQRAHLLVHPSALEGGAHVVMEAVCSGTPVLASRVPGNVGMLGPDYEGYFEHGDAAQLAQLLQRCRAEQLAHASQDAAGGLLQRLRRQCEERAPLFAPHAEQAALRRLVAQLGAGARP